MSTHEQNRKVNWALIVVLALVIAALALGAIYYLRTSVAHGEEATTDAEAEEQPVDQEESEEAPSEAPVMGKVVTIETDKGTIKFALYEEDAPVTTANFAKLAKSKFYDGLTFHRVEPGFVIQGGCPKGDGTGKSDEQIPLETSPKLKHDAAGVVAMARSSDPNSASCQFYITLGPATFLDGNYAVFGRVTEGMDVVEKIERGDKMTSVTVAE